MSARTLSRTDISRRQVSECDSRSRPGLVPKPADAVRLFLQTTHGLRPTKRPTGITTPFDFDFDFGRRVSFADFSEKNGLILKR